MKFKLKDTNLFLLPGNSHMLHIASIEYGLREFVLMLDRKTSITYIEEVVLESNDLSNKVWANFKQIEDDNLWNDLAEFVSEKKLVDMKKISEVILDEQKIKLF